ncbi:LLM class flavin-dependent oxidoreductase [Mycolicibacterium confluentis]|uniref:Monooxygenase n=1 Tax=Mycolicibacterium confluentis TaxID=28047 RepID=A0A7I7XSQ7_9MYCO|nr:LLM class flavin-dependent oxidoreductase [Mycolicibacterium confluentis]BBZ32103.1 monooxygenase [Mycolicibacterium confluentis]
MSENRKLHLTAFLMPYGQHEAAWRLPGTPLNAEFDPRYWIDLARRAEAAKFDSIFFADAPGQWASSDFQPQGALDPLILLTAIAGATERIGLIGTVSTTYNSPYNLARRFASLDHISGGRAGWNIVTTSDQGIARNFGREGRPDHLDRYRRADEFVDVVTKLWDSWTDDYIVGSRESGRYSDAAHIREINHRGEFYSVAGPLTVPRSPQGWPVLVQAGSSENGKAFGARHGEAIFTAQPTLEDGQEFYTDFKARVAAAGRDPGQTKVLPGLMPYIGSTEKEAQAQAQKLDDLRAPERGLANLSDIFEYPVEAFELDKSLPAELYSERTIEGDRSRADLILKFAAEENLNVRQLISYLGGARGHFTVIGTPEQIADTIEAWFTRGAADGFNVMPPAFPESLDLFIEHVIPELQRRGLFRTEYEGRTLRDHYGLAKPANRLDQVTSS